MPLELKTITFDHNPLSATTSALNIRRNKDFEAPIPEYDAAIPRTAAESCAAYAIRETEGNKVFVRVEFTLTPAANAAYEVRASGGGLLGALDPQKVVFAGGATSQSVNFPLSHRHFHKVQRHDITWHWQYRPQGSAVWTNLVSTSHRIYLVLKVPPAPWTQTPADKRNPWTDLLDTCCVTASGSHTQAQAAAKIIKSVHTGYQLRYDIETGADRYGFALSGMSFELTNWIDFVLHGNAPANPVFCGGTAEQYKDFQIVNCYDCAASSALMAKIVGADSDYYFHEPFGYLNYVLPIGRGKCNNPFPGCTGGNPAVGPDDPRTSFGNHAYTKLGGSRNYDACMREWVPPSTRALLILIWLIILIFTLGLVNLQSLLDRADGWLIDLPQSDYDARTVDVSQPFELAGNGGTPVLQVLQFSVT